ncbi:MAG: cell division protein FtsI/penicillin-binding protein 2 [Planctomycetota bacterium]|jgi:cell division protein FtsI/penicillin-binding protein 2
MLRRFAAPMGVVLLALLFLITRLHEVSVGEHDIWAREAASLERSAHRVPYQRGRILDRNGDAWVVDQVRYEIEFVWRDFRRGHPLGNIVQLMSLTLMRPVDLQEVSGGDAARWADHLTGLSPDQVAVFARGGTLSFGGVEIPALPEKDRRGARREERRPARAQALRYYIERLMGVTRKEWQALRDLRDSDRSGESYAQLVAELRRREDEVLGSSIQRLQRELRERVDRSILHLEELGNLVDWSELQGGELGLPAGNLERVVQVLDRAREQSENKAADRLFQIAAGFPARHLAPENLRRFDLGWLKKCLYWDDVRLESWLVQRGGQYAHDVDRYVAGYVFARMQLAPGSQVDRVLDSLAHEFVHPADRPDPRKELVTPWRTADRLRTLADLPNILEDWELSDYEPDWVLPFQDPELRSLGLSGSELLKACLRPAESNFGGRAATELIARALLGIPGKGAARRTDWGPGDLDPIKNVLLVWNESLDYEVGVVLQGMPQPVLFNADRVRGALEDRDHVIKDMSSRPLIFTDKPSDALVHHVERYHMDYVGLQVNSVRSRAFARNALEGNDDAQQPDRLLAANWIGKVRSPQLVSLLERSGQEAEARALWRKVELDEQDRSFVTEAAADSFLPSQTVGGSGIEGYFDQELRGRNGFREVIGLQQSTGSNGRRALYRKPQDGLDLQLTLDMEIQRAAEQVINHPNPPPAGEEKPDMVWIENPVGAIVAITPDGQVLAAASAPVLPTEPGPYQDDQRRFATDRVLRKPKFLPPGSIMKPMVAAWALQKLGMNPDAPRVNCNPLTDYKTKEGSGYGGVSCHRYWGHSHQGNTEAGKFDIDLRYAIRVSCNTYFAQVGDTLYDETEFQKMFHAFGIGERTGIMSLGRQGRSGWLEDYSYKELASFGRIHRQRLANGLTHVTVTPMQMARAYAGLATGVLPTIRVVQSIGGREWASEGQSLPIDAVNLGIVRRAMDQVANVDGGSAFEKGLSETDLDGMRFVCKTGSADYKGKELGMVPNLLQKVDRDGNIPEFIPGVRKHTWVVGWLPADDPKLIVAVYVHDTSTTSSHSSVYVMAQFLQHPTIKAYLKGVR